jgi:hypothetical protein
LVIERLESVVMLAIEEEAARRLSKRVPKVEVYTPFVTVAALPLIEPLMREENVFEPEKVFVSERRVEDAEEPPVAVSVVPL